MADFLEIKGAREHNLKNVDLKIPRDKLVVITGLSGSGKSSLAFDTIYAEGQRRYMESLNSYARQFLGTMDKPDVDQITGLSPAISIDQKSTSRNPRSTVATVTEIYDYLRLLFARIGTPHCPICGRDVVRRTPQSIVDGIMNLKEGSRLILLAPIAKSKKGEFAHVPVEFSKKGFARARVDGVIYALDEFPELEKNIKHNIEIVVDRLVLSKEMRTRLAQSVEQALDMTNGILEVLDDETGEVKIFSQRYACELHPDEHIPELEPRLFSFNAPQGACETCSGLGTRMEIDPELVLSPNLTISEGAIRPYNRVMEKGYRIKLLEEVAKRHGFSTKVPTKKLSKEAIEIILYGTKTDEKYPIEMNGRVYNMNFEGVIPNLERRHRDTDSEFQRKDIERFMRVRKCQTCGGKRLKPVVLAVTVAGLNIVEICDLAIDEAVELFKNLELNEQQKFISTQILKEISSRLGFMNNVGLNYLELSRAANTLSGGEAQRIRLATQIGSGLQGVLYVLDEPSIGLHQRDNDKLIATLKNLRDLNNTVLVVEHDEDTIRAADWLVDVGPGAGVNGGMIVASGTPEEVSKNPKSLTGKFLSGEDKIQTPKNRRKIQKNEKLVIKNARENNLKNIDVEIPLGVMTVVSGVSGSGKSTLVNEILSKELLARKH
ncbi:MAG: excinuclease ABC subunit UvrA, partial [Candidatus Nanogingivalaceae bacterium]|nr:excinuclease ABC subunit UvrA [Candidatus Nanogingivalaceae bacterium]